MAVKSIVEIDLQDDKFKSFKRLHDQYVEALKKTPAQWALVNQAMARSEASEKRQLSVVQGLLAAARDMPTALDAAAVKWGALDRVTLRVASTVRDITSSLLRWGAISGVATGILGLGGLFGIDRMAGGVSAARRSALGLGTGYGERQAFSASFSRLVDPESFLSSVAGAKMDVQQRVGLLGAKLSQGEIAGDTAQTAVALLRNLKRIADTTNPAFYGQVIGARRLGQFTSPEDLQRLHNTSPAEFASLLARYGSNKGSFDVPADVTRKWQEFTTQMTIAGQGIENTFVRGLAPLTPGLTKLSSAFEKTVENFIGSNTIKKWLDEADKGLEKFAGYIGTEDFQRSVETFVKGLGALGNMVWNFVSRFGGGSGEHADVRDRVKWARRETDGRSAAQLRLERANGKSAWTQFGDIFGGGNDLLSTIRKLEGSGDSAVSPKGAIGRYQIMPDTARQYGMDPSRLTDPTYNEAAAKKILADLVKRYHGNAAEVLAGYNAGPGAADRFRKAGDDISVLPAETQKYVTRGQYLLGTGQVSIRIDNNTGGNANVSVNALKN
jgi:hypothetical protein